MLKTASPRHNRALKTLLTSDSLYFTALAMYTPIFAIFVQRIHGDLIASSIAWSLMSLTIAVTIYFVRTYGGKVKEGELLISFGYFLAGFGFWMLTLVSSVIGLYFVVIVLGIAHGIRSPMFDAVYSKHLDKGKYVREWGNWEMLYNVVTGVGSIVGGLLVSNFGFSIIFSIMGTLSMAASCCIYFKPRNLL